MRAIARRGWRATTLLTGSVGLLLAVVGTTPITSAPSAGASSAAPTSTCGNGPTTVATEPSQLLPPRIYAFPGYTRIYCSEFMGTALPSSWTVFSGMPKGDPSGMFAPSHVRVGGGMLHLNTYKDPAHPGLWTSGGVCQCGIARDYGVYFVRARITTGGPGNVLLLWPQNNHWPPEVDFLESWRLPVSTTSTLHFKPGNQKVQKTIGVDLTKWHTWGVFWTPTSIKFSLDKYIWWTITSPREIPKTAMTLDIQQQSWCGILDACPTVPSSMLIDWVAEYVSNTPLHAGRPGTAAGSAATP